MICLLVASASCSARQVGRPRFGLTHGCSFFVFLVRGGCLGPPWFRFERSNRFPKGSKVKPGGGGVAKQKGVVGMTGAHADRPLVSLHPWPGPELHF